jgi:NAD(P)-dependent dehydrogenase (short-subunit alcohol dehydrogenase family)
VILPVGSFPTASVWRMNLLQAKTAFVTGMRINVICPGLVATGMTRPIFEQARWWRAGAVAP